MSRRDTLPDGTGIEKRKRTSRPRHISNVDDRAVANVTLKRWSMLSIRRRRDSDEIRRERRRQPSARFRSINPQPILRKELHFSALQTGGISWCRRRERQLPAVARRWPTARQNGHGYALGSVSTLHALWRKRPAFPAIRLHPDDAVASLPRLPRKARCPVCLCLYDQQ